jgi:hypothetical protein
MDASIQPLSIFFMLQLPTRINSVIQYANETEANAEIRRIESDLTTARQRVCFRNAVLCTV